MRLRSGGLFAGAGALELAVGEALEADPAWLAEFDAAPSKVLAFRFPGVPNYGDVTKIRWAEVEPVEVVCAGYPCQPFSLAGRRKGTDDERHLWPYIVEAVRVLRPRWVALENVRGHLSMGFDEVLRDLTRLGYDAEWVILKASSVGAPHKRERLFILAWAKEVDDVEDRRPFAYLLDDGWLNFEEGFFGPVPFDGRLPTAGSLRSGTLYDAPTPADDGEIIVLPTPVVADARGARNVTSGRSVGSEHHSGTTLTDAVSLLPTPSVANAHGNEENGRGEHLLPGVATSLFPTPRASDGEKGGPNQRGRRGDLTMSSAVQLLPTPEAKLATSGPDYARMDRDGSGGDDLTTTIFRMRKEEPGTDWGKYTGAVRRWERVFGFGVPSPVKFDGKGGKARLSSLLTEWMMGFLPGWITDPEIGLTRSEQLKICGNGVVQQQAAAAYRLLLARRGVPAVRAEVVS